MNPNHIITLGDVLKYQAPKAKRLFIATALMNDYGLDFLKKVPSSCAVKLLIGVDLPTPYEVIKALSESHYDTRIFRDPAKSFHPKVYLLEIEGKWQAYVGSANFTQGGFESNVEMTIGSGDDEHTKQLLEWFDLIYKRGKPIDDQWLKDYRIYTNELSELEAKRKQLLQDFKKRPETNDPLTKYDFTGQFFQYEHYNAFSGSKPWERTDPGVIKERLNVKRKLLDLHNVLWQTLQPKKWNVEPHYESNNIVSSHEHSIGTADRLHSLWLSYNRPKKEFRKLDPNATPLTQMRLQVLVHHMDCAIHLTVGKDGGGYFERKNINEKLRRRDTSFLENFQLLLTDLPDSFYINVAGEKRSVRDFSTNEELRDYVLKDDLDNHYFLIGTAYEPNDPKLRSATIVSTIVSDFERLIPLYKFFTVPV